MSEILDQYEGDATIVQDQQTIRARCEYTVEQERIYSGPDESIPGLRSWSGSLRPVTPIDLGEATLHLPDGSTGTIIVHAIETVDVTAYGEIWQGALLGATAAFQGAGPAPLRSIR